MRVTIAAVGTRLPPWAEAAIDELLQRFPADYSVTVRAVKAVARGSASIERLRATEAERLRAALPTGAPMVVLDERGREFATTDFAANCARWAAPGRLLGFVIGGADGLDEDLVRGARAVVSLSRMTLPHALARLMLVEQLYRAWSIGAGHPYHRA
ncbi:MAG TPA: 23S rRNA (pseudouridine(1915)-N(3))-methyltransferase RlmH [Burkholderiaceae bacterium]|nr:23S rRNA (pseudouridine(1915)-N(3))-methyltransferase RlmH [Burkholderiaceae bacterium]